MKFAIICFALLGIQCLADAKSLSAREMPIAELLQKDVRVIGGNPVTDDSASYQVSIQNTFGEHVCGGSIIAPDWILTAAHCMEWPKQYLKIITGTVKWRIPDAEYTVAEVKVHCQHDKPMYANDIALIRLNKSIVFNAHTKPVQLADANTLNDGDKLYLTGWGSTKLWGNTPDDLQKVELQYLIASSCASKVKDSSWLHQGHICSFTKAGEGSCHGDSGGPLVDANSVQVGVVNWGQPCAIGYPDVYASVAYYRDWIESAMDGTGTTC